MEKTMWVLSGRTEALANLDVEAAYREALQDPGVEPGPVGRNNTRMLTTLPPTVSDAWR